MSDYQSVAPTTTAITLTEAKAHLNVSSTVDDTLITTQLKAATLLLENKTQRCFIKQTRITKADDFADSRYVHNRRFYPPRSPLSSVTSLKYIDTAGTTITMPSSDYVVSTGDQPGFVAEAYDASWPTVLSQPNAVELTYVAGHAEGNGVFDMSSNANHGTRTGGAAQSTDVPAVLTGKSLSLDGTDDYVNVPNGATIVSGASAATISLWFKADDTAGQRGLINFGTTAKMSLYIRIGEIFIWDSVASRALTFSDTTSWHHLTVVFDGSLAAANRWKFYLDGVYAAFTYSSGVPIPATLPSMSGEPIQIGQLAALTYYFDGLLDDVRVFNVAKTAAQAAALAAGTDDQTGIVGQWTFDENQVPEEIKQALMMIVGHWYRNREAVFTGSITKDIEWGVDALLESEMVEGYA